MNKKKSIAKNYIYNLIYQILVIILPLITTPYISRVLGAENIGIYSYTLSITTYFILFGTLGVASYGHREIAYVQESMEKRSKVFYEINIMRLITLSISMVFFYSCFCLHGRYSMYYKILLLEIIANCIDISWFFQGMEEFKKTVTRNIVIKFVSVICIFLFVKSRTDLGLYILIYVLSTFLGNALLWFYLPKYITKVKWKELNFFRHLKPMISLFIPQIAIQMYTVLDKTMIGAIVPDKAETGFYEQSQRIIKILLTLATSLGTVMAPRIANTFAKGDYEKIKEYMLSSFSFILMIAFPLLFGIISISSNFVPIFFGSGYDKVILLMNIISPIILFIGLSNVIGTQYLLPTKQHKKYTISVLMGACVNFILNLFLIKKYASVGASVATVIAECCVTCMQFYLVRKELKIKDVLKISHKYFIASIIMFIVSILIGYTINNNLLSLIVQVPVAMLIYFSLLFLMKDTMFLQGIKKIQNKLCKKE